MAKLGELEEFITAEETFEVIDSFNFVGTRIDRDGGCTSEIARWIAIGKAEMNGLSHEGLSGISTHEGTTSESIGFPCSDVWL